MRKKQKNDLPLPFIIFFIFVSLLIIIYLSMPIQDKKIREKRTYEEQLEYNIAPKKQRSTPVKISYTQSKRDEKAEIQQQQQNSNFIPQKNTSSTTIKRTTINKSEGKTNNLAEYNKLLNTLASYPGKSIGTVELIVNKILIFKGYPPGIIKVVPDTLDQSAAKTQGSFLVANFEFPSGHMNISREQIYNLDIKVIIAIIAHELDHFDKLAKVCKSMGTVEFKNFLAENRIKNADTDFWALASKYADINDFDAELYKKSIQRYLNQNKIELTSSYSDFYRLSENMRNPLEISAYKVSDYIYDYYNIPITEGPMKQITRAFNEVDWAIYNKIKDNNILKKERIAFFDYYFSKAIIKTYPVYKNVYNNCLEARNGDLTMFWIAFEKTLNDFYGKGKIDADNLKKILTLLDATKNETQEQLTTDIVCIVLKCKINTLLANIVYPDAIKNLKKTTLSYLKYLKTTKTEKSKDELDCILTLFCIENELYTNNMSDISLYYIKIPEEITTLYNIKNKNQRFHFIYSNNEFKRIMLQAKSEQKNISEQNLLIALLNSHRVNKKI